MKKKLAVVAALALAGSLSASMLGDALNNAAKDAANNAVNNALGGGAAQEHLKENYGLELPTRSMDQAASAVRTVMARRGFGNVHVEGNAIGYGGQGRKLIATKTATMDLGAGVKSYHVELTIVLHRKWAEDGRSDGGSSMVGVSTKRCVSGTGDCDEWSEMEKNAFRNEVLVVLYKNC